MERTNFDGDDSCMRRWVCAGYVNADLHNHFCTSHQMNGLLGKILGRVRCSGKSPAMLGVIDFNNFGEQSRFTQLKREAGDRAYDFGNALYFPIQDVLLVKGQEVPTKEGHLLVVGLDEKQHLRPDESFDYSIRAAQDYNGITIVDHPFSPNGGLGSFLMANRKYLERLDAWEVHNGEAVLFWGANRKANDTYKEEIQGKYNIGALSGSDGHSIYEIGRSSTCLDMPAYSSLNSGKDLTNTLRNAIKSKNNSQTKKPAIIGALNHIADLATLMALSKIGIRK